MFAVQINTTPMFREAITNRIKELGLSKRKVAIDVGIIYQNFNQYLLGKRPLPHDDIEAVLKYLDLEIKPKAP
jgi:transcriptional regulator with XRE-family HTH domain